MDEVVLPARRSDGLCNARTPDGYCLEPSGIGTPHPGAGRCKTHEKGRNRRPLRWEEVEDDDIRTALGKFASDEDALDTLDDILLMRAVIKGMVDRQERLVDAMLKWAEDSGEKPREAPSFIPVIGALDKLSGMVEKEAKRRASGNITLNRLAAMLSMVGAVIEAHVSDEEVLRRIREGLLGINLNELSGKR